MSIRHGSPTRMSPKVAGALRPPTDSPWPCPHGKTGPSAQGGVGPQCWLWGPRNEESAEKGLGGLGTRRVREGARGRAGDRTASCQVPATGEPEGPGPGVEASGPTRPQEASREHPGEQAQEGAPGLGAPPPQCRHPPPGAAAAAEDTAPSLHKGRRRVGYGWGGAGPAKLLSLTLSRVHPPVRQSLRGWSPAELTPALADPCSWSCSAPPADPCWSALSGPRWRGAFPPAPRPQASVCRLGDSSMKTEAPA